MEIGRRIYFDKTTGDVIIDTGEKRGSVVATSIDYEISVFKPLSERNRESFDYIELEYGAYRQDFMECDGYRVNTKTKSLEFSYPNPENPEPEPEYQQPLSTEVANIKQLVNAILGVDL